MHKLYRLSYVIIEGKERDYFWDSFLFTEEEQKPIVDYTYNSFDDFYNAVVSNSLPVFIDYGKTILLHDPYIRIDGMHFDRIITKRDFVKQLFNDGYIYVNIDFDADGRHVVAVNKIEKAMSGKILRADDFPSLVEPANYMLSTLVKGYIDGYV